MAEYAAKVCPECRSRFVPARSNQEYCSSAHRKRRSERERRAAVRAAAAALVSGRVPDRVAREDSGDGRASARRGPRYEAFCAAGWPVRIGAHERGAVGGVSVGDVVEATGESQANVSRWYAAWLEDSLTRARADGWVRDAAVEASLCPQLPMRFVDLVERYQVELDAGADLDALVERLLTEAEVAFGEFRAMFFRDERGEAYRTPRVHKRWIRRILRAMLLGRRQLILSPPRHGKTQLLIHFVVWLICRFPNIRIMWIGGNEDIAKNAVGAVLDELENNVALVAAVLGPGGSFKPAGRGGKSWTSKALTVATRVGTGIKSATLIAVGKGGKLLSRDADLIIPDDIIDHDSVQSPKQRDDDFAWINTQVSSRKEEHTAIVAIGSRQHHQDLFGRLAVNPAWSAMVEHAHDPACDLPTHPFVDPELHVDCAVCAAHVDCMLFPEIRSFAWLMDMRASFDDDLLYEMVYQNITRPEGAEYITVEHLRFCRSDRVLGHVPEGCQLIGGLDPATAGFQGAVLWAWDPKSKKRYLVDLDNRRAGGMPGAEAITKLWFDKYELRTWVWETGAFQEGYRQHTPIKDFCAQNGIVIYPHITDRWNKWDKDLGVTAQMALFRRTEIAADGVRVPAPLIDLPYGDAASIEQVREYETQLLNFEPTPGVRVRRAQDLLMAGWFPETRIRLWKLEQQSVVESNFERTGYFDGGLGDVYDGITAA